MLRYPHRLIRVELVIVDTRRQKKFNEASAKKFVDIIIGLVEMNLGRVVAPVEGLEPPTSCLTDKHSTN